MVTVAPAPSAPVAPAGPCPARLQHLGPNWYASVMGTAVIGSAGAALPGHPEGLRTLLAGFWVLSLVALVTLLAARALRRARHRDWARGDLLDPAAAPFYGCLAMALLAVGGGAMTAGRPVLGTAAAVVLDAVLFTAGTVVGLAAAVAVPYLMAVRHRVEPSQAGPVWLLPLVAPMVSAAVGPLLVPHLPPGQPRATLLLACLALFGLSLFATLLMLPLVFARLVASGPPPLALAPTLFLVLGPLGQSTTAVALIAEAAPGAVPAPYARGLEVFAVLYGVPVMGFALLWLAFATAHVVRARRHGMGFSMTWWAFTFPVGTCVTGAAALARHTGLTAYGALAAGLYAVLAAAWLAAASGTVRGLLSGALPAGLRPAPAAPAPVTGRTRSGAAR
ncbi:MULTISPECIES: TDT family transporter [unclassified Streptomyces]|uniref:TDT family transporter n=1 Tax=unclassified Streptomyces TaxID=2593676 RepID=UPI000F4981A4|nr:TDT family transporter [Streptomyces sp. PanSC9]ROP54313.1 C4-dicarboxylate transporter/malic acid transport protein [Streptomyces sp. PanSC9]